MSQEPYNYSFTIAKIEHMLKLLDESLNPLVPFTGNMEQMMEASELKRVELINAVRLILYQSPGVTVREDLEKMEKKRHEQRN